MECLDRAGQGVKFLSCLREEAPSGEGGLREMLGGPSRESGGGQ